jgi:hypothetical protein
MKRMRDHLGAAWLACAIVAFLGSNSLAGLTAMTVSPEPITVGWATTYTVTDDGQDSGYASYQWDFRATEPGNQTPWTALPGQSTSTQVIEARVGSYNVRCRATYRNPMTGQQTTSEIVRSVTVSGPDHDQITSGLNVSTSSSSLTVEFLVLNGTIILGGTVDGHAEERIRRPQYGFDSGFVGQSSTFYYQYGYIVDVKSTNLQHPDFLKANIGDAFDDFYQQNRMVIKDGFGRDQFFYFPERHFQRVKTGANSWKLIEL